MHGAGGYGMLIGPGSIEAEMRGVPRSGSSPRRRSTSRSRRSRCRPARRFVEAGLAPRHIDLRPYVLSGTDIDLVPGGLTRVALREGSLVVNSSQGGGTKDTWVLAE